MSNHKDSYTRDEILALFIEAHSKAASQESRARHSYILGWVLGGLNIAEDYRAATEAVSA